MFESENNMLTVTLYFRLDTVPKLQAICSILIVRQKLEDRSLRIYLFVVFVHPSNITGFTFYEKTLLANLMPIDFL